MPTVAPPGAAVPSTMAPKPASDARVGLAGNFDNFLKLLTTQLTNQDPLEPLDANEFTAQLVQFSGVEQSIKTNQMLDELVALTRVDQLSRSADYLGAEVEADGSTIRLGASGTAALTYRLGKAAAAVDLTIRDERGASVWQAAGDGEAGAHTLAWDGSGATGRRLPEGLYSLEVTASDVAGRSIPASTSIAGTVDGVEYGADHQVMLSIDGVLMPLDALRALRRPAAEPAA